MEIQNPYINTALAHAAAHNETKIVAIAIVGKEDPQGEKLCHPCGICKQLIWENSMKSKIPVKVVMANLKGKYIVKDIKDIVPYPWPDYNGKDCRRPENPHQKRSRFLFWEACRRFPIGYWPKHRNRKNSHKARDKRIQRGKR